MKKHGRLCLSIQKSTVEVGQKERKRDEKREKQSDDEMVTKVEEHGKERRKEGERRMKRGEGRASVERQRTLGRKQLLARCNENNRASVSQ